MMQWVIDTAIGSATARICFLVFRPWPMSHATKRDNRACGFVIEMTAGRVD
jgi:hypothetical protein